MDTYSQLNRAQLSFDYLHTNSTTHEFLFGAIAELIDNSRDAGATELDIYTSEISRLRTTLFSQLKTVLFEEIFCSVLQTMGAGCLQVKQCDHIWEVYEEIRGIFNHRYVWQRVEIVSFGSPYHVLPSGSMRIGNDMMLFTKKDGIYTCLFLSRSFHEEEKLDEVVVPLPSFKGPEKVPVVETPEDKKRHEVEMHLILKYSPFRCMKDFFAQFDKLKEASGTLVIIYNMKLLDHGAPELDIITNPRDILLASGAEHEEMVEPDAEVMLPPERRSLRAYVSILYSDPRMKVYLQGRKVQTKRLLANLYNPRKYNFASKTFRTRAEADLTKAKNDVKIAELRAQEAESKARDCELRYQGSEDPEHLRQIRRLRNTAAELRNAVAVRQNTVTRKQKSIRDPKTLTFYFGVNVMNRACDGMFVYNCSRLIKMYQRIGPQQDSSMMCRGVVGIVDVPYMVLEPTHNKQDFADAKEYRMLMRAMADHLMQYWDDLSIDKEPDSLVRFWKSFGYLSARWRDPPSNEEKYARRRCCSVSICVQCDKCLKWRILPFSQSLVGRDVPDTWQCRDNPDNQHKRCDAAEEDMSPPMGVLKRKIKTKEQRQAELEKQIRKKQEELESIQEPDDDNDSSTSSRTARSQTASAPKPAAPPVSPRKRGAPTPSTGPPNKKPSATTPPAPPPRAMTVAEKKRQAAAATNGPTVTLQKRTGLPLPTVNQRQPRSGGLVPKTQQQPSSGSKAQNGRGAALERLDSSKTANAVSDAPGQKRSTVADAGGDKGSNAPSRKDSLLPTVPAAESNLVVLALSKRIQDKFKVCLRYFLPPEWPMQKDQIHTLSDLELANFPLEDFFDRYEQGLRSLLATFQQETKIYVDRLTDLRGNVARLLASVDPNNFINEALLNSSLLLSQKK
ncbi:CW-type Zinc Finger [Opisthorchis viverrini]|uniref:CW-type Zinc Finger n=1 Tax=Opisthorchis viverrini TaxID=6198 RepID=A0A1S8WJV9_OPIVI|nr:CW-type Zinc Finger [Opisthorchis viverrini]